MPTPLGAGGLSRRRHRAAAAAVALACVLACLSLTSTPAHAHGQLVASSPSDAEHLDAAPTEVRLSFNDEPLELGTTVMVTDMDGTDFALTTVLDGQDVVTALPALPDGHYDLRWRVVSSDGHPIAGVIPFSVGEVGERPERSPQPPPEAVDPAAAESPAGEAGLPGPVRTVLVAGAGAAAALLVLWVIGRVRRRL